MLVFLGRLPVVRLAAMFADIGTVAGYEATVFGGIWRYVFIFLFGLVGSGGGGGAPVAVDAVIA